jgi:hypothetical protein
VTGDRWRSEALKRANQETGGSVVEMAERRIYRARQRLSENARRLPRVPIRTAVGGIPVTSAMSPPSRSAPKCGAASPN